MNTNWKTPFWGSSLHENLSVFTQEGPKILWVELTSKCPLNCEFCSRKLLRGDGQHMDFSVYKRLINDLIDPKIIRLNYSGESIHYPQLIEAINLASASGATVELVTALVSIKKEMLRKLASSKLDLLTISLHTLDDAAYPELYKFGTLSRLKQCISELLIEREKMGTGPKIDFGFVAMKSNLSQLNSLADYAQRIGITKINICPITRRDPIQKPYSYELENNRLTPLFRKELGAAINEVQSLHSNIDIHITNTENKSVMSLDSCPRTYAKALPEYGRIFSCDQNPWETVHVLANGSVVVCEVQDKTAIGNLHDQSIQEIWHGQRYVQFRRDYVQGRNSECNKCPWKMAFVPGILSTSVSVHKYSSQLLRGWYAPETNLVWSKTNSLLIIRTPYENSKIELKGIIPPSKSGKPNKLEIYSQGSIIGVVENDTDENKEFFFLSTIKSDSASLMLAFKTLFAFHPGKHSQSDDTRALGFAFISAIVKES